MVAQFWQVFWEEFRALFRGRFPVGTLLLLAPIGFTLLFGAIYAENVVNDIPLVVYDADQSALSRQLIEAYGDSDRFHIVAYVTSEEAMRQRLYSGEAMAALGIPQDFSKNVRLGNGAEVLLMVNSTNNMFGNAALSASQEIARSFSVAVGQKLVEGLGVLPEDALKGVYPVRLGVRIAGNPTNGYAPFMLSGLMLNGLQIGLMVAFAPFVVGVVLRRRFAGVPVGVVLAAGVLPYLLLALVGYGLSLFLCVEVFAVPLRGSLFSLAALGAAFLVFVAGALCIFSVCSPTRELSLQAPMVYIMPGLLYSGLSWPVFDMTDVATAFGRCLPLTYAGDMLRDLLLTGSTAGLGENIGIMAGAGLGCFLVAGLLLRLRLRRGFYAGDLAGGEGAP